MRKAQIVVTSCHRRSLELEQVKSFLRGNGYSVINEDFEPSEDADLILHSTCAFTAASEDFAIQTVRRIQQRKKPSAKVIVCGCLPEINPRRLSEVFDGETFGPRSYERLNEILKPERELREFPRPNTLEINRSLKSTIAKAKTLIASYDGNLHGLEYIIARIKNHAASNAISKIAEYGHDEVFYIQIQEGCPCKCSYCAIRLAIKDLKSKPVDDVIEELREGLERGYKKFCLMGDSAAAYGLDIGTNLGNLLGRVREIERNFSLNLTDISPTFLEPCFAEIRALCRDDRIHSLYVPIQSGSPRILRLMKRSCNLDRVKDMLLELKSISRVMIGTSIIVGFPSETSEELKDTIDFCRQVSFDWIYCHSFSARPETEAARLPGQFSAAEVLRRSRLARSALHDKTRITTAEDAKGSRTCQG